MLLVIIYEYLEKKDEFIIENRKITTDYTGNRNNHWLEFKKVLSRQ